VSIKNKLVTAVTTAGLLAGLFGSAFVPAVRATAFTNESDEVTGWLYCKTAISETACQTTPGSRVTVAFNALIAVESINATTGATAAGDVYWIVDKDGDRAAADEIASVTYAAEVDEAPEWYISASGADSVDEDGLPFGSIANEDTDNAACAAADAADDLSIAKDEVYQSWLELDWAAAGVSSCVDAGAVSFDVTRATAGSVTISLFYFRASDNKKVTVQTETITFGTSAVNDEAIDWDNSETVVGLRSNGGACAAGTVTQDDVDSSKSMEAGDTTGIDLCIALMNEAGDAITDNNVSANIEIEISDNKGVLDIGSDGSSYADDWDTLDADGDGDLVVDIAAEDTDVEPVVSTVTVTITQDDSDLGIDETETFTLTVTQYGTFVEITLVNTAYSLGGAVDDDVEEFYAEDAAGNLVPLDLTTTTEMVIDSDYSSLATIDEAGEEDALAAVALTTDATSARYESGSATESYGEIEVNCDDTTKEKLTFKLIVENDDADEITSNTVTVYCADAADSISYVSAVRDGGTTIVTVSVKDENGYPVPDATTVTAATSVGAFSDASINPENGLAEFTFLATGRGTATMVFGADLESLTKALSYGGVADLQKLNGTTVVAAFGSDAAGEVVTFSVVKVSTGKTLTVTKTANASGRATYTLGARRSGKWAVTATYGDEITNVRYVNR